MDLRNRVYSVLVVSAAENVNSALSDLLPETKYNPVHTVTSISAAKRSVAETSYDYVIINAPLPDDIGTGFAVDTAHSSGTVVLMMVRSEIYADIYYKAVEHGVFVLSKPTSKPTIAMALSWMASVRERLRRSEKRTISIEDKMAEIRIVNKAKWILIAELHMDEPAAHRYIEKQAMDRCISKRAVAEEIIKTYT